MKATELRIGNYVVGKKWPEYDLELIVVTSVDDIGINLEEGLGEGIRREFHHHELSPIPLTPQILEHLGFKKVHTELEPVAFTYSLEIPVDGDNKNEIHFTVVKMGNSESHGNYLVNDHWASNNFKYLHQLQNLYFALTGEELTVNFKDLTYQ